MKRLAVSELRSNCSEVLRRVANGVEVEITRHGRTETRRGAETRYVCTFHPMMKARITIVAP